MAKLSVYNTIDRSQLGGKFVPLIQSGVSNYKILASDLGKEYHPGDAIEITDTGEINVNYDQNTLELSGSELSVKTDYDRGVFKGSDGIYIASADESIGISRTGIKVNPEAFVGSGLSYHKYRLSVNAKTPLSADADGLSLLIGGAGLEIVSGCLYLDSSVVSHTAADAVYYYMSTRTGSSLAIDQGHLVVDTKYIASAGLTTGFGNYNPISVDIKYVANAIGNTYIGSGLYWDNNNYTLSANVNTATGIIVQDNRLYLNAGNGLQTTNNTVNVKVADNTINVSYEGIKVNTGYGLSSTHGLYVKSADNTIGVSEYGIKVNTSALAPSLAGMGLHSYGDALYVKSADRTIGVSDDGIKVNTSNLSHSLPGKGLYSDNGKISVYTDSASALGFTSTGALYLNNQELVGQGIQLGANGKSFYVKSADNTIGVTDAGVKVNTGSVAAAIFGQGLEYSSGKLNVYYGSGLAIDTETGKLYATSVTPEIGQGLLLFSRGASPAELSVYAGSGLTFDTKNRLSVYAGSGLEVDSEGRLYVKSADNTINVSSSGISVNKSALSIPTASSLVGSGLTSRGSYLYVQSADGSIGVGVDGIKVNAASGLETTSSGLYVKSADNTITVGSDGIKVNTLEPLVGLGLEWSGAQALYVKSADSTIEVSDSGIRVHTSQLAGYGLSAISNGLYVHSADGTIGVTSSGIGVNVTSGGGLLTGANGLYIDSGQLAGNGLAYYSEQNNVKLYVKSADNTIDVSSAGIKVNTSALPTPTAESLAGHGLMDNPYSGKLDIYYGSGLDIDKSLGKVIVKSADNSIDVSDNGIKVRTYDNQGVFVGNHGVYIRSADSSIGLSTAGIKVNAGYGLVTSTDSIYVKSANDSISVSSDGVKVNPTALAGASLYVDSANETLNVEFGDGLTTGYRELKVQAANNTINVSSEGIKVNTSLLAKDGLGTDGLSLYVLSADTSLVVGTNGLYIDPGDGLSRDDSGLLCIKSKDGSIVPTWEGLSVDIRNAAYIGAGLTTANGDLKVKNADNTISVTSDGIKVTEGFWSPDYSSGVTATQNTEYTADANCWLYMEVSNSSSAGGAYVEKSIVIDGITVADLSACYWTRIAIMVPCKKGSTYRLNNNNTGTGAYKLIVYKCLE